MRKVNTALNPNTSDGFIDYMQEGQGFTILGELHDWWQIELGGKIGWVRWN